MRRVVASEWVKLRTKGMLAALGGVIAVAVLGTVITVLTVGSSTSTKASGGGPGGVPGFISFAQITSSHGLADALGNAGTLLGVIVMGVVAASVAGEFSTGTLRNLLVREPRRARLLAGKLLGLASAIVLAVVVAFAIAILAGVLAAASKGLPIHAWASGSGVGATGGAVVELVGATLGWGVLGAVLAVVFRSPVVAVVVGVVYALPLESILGAISGSVSRWLPGKLLAAIAAGGNSTATLTAGSWTIVVYAAIAIGGTLLLFTRRDVPV
jgi:ABC-type transport system involved in multi-copper enzyme maturation permease subunit